MPKTRLYSVVVNFSAKVKQTNLSFIQRKRSIYKRAKDKIFRENIFFSFKFALKHTHKQTNKKEKTAQEMLSKSSYYE